MSKREIKIVVERRSGLKLVQKQNDFAGHLSPKGIIERARETDYLPRRLQQKGGWRFFDLGQLLVEGVYTDAAFTAASNLSINYPAKTIDTDEPAAADVAAKAEFYTSRDLSALATDFYKFRQTSPENFRIRFKTQSIPWTRLDATAADRWASDDTIRIEPDDDLSYVYIDASPLFEPVYIQEGFNKFLGDKVTAEPDPDADELTDFQLARKADFYLTPSYALPTVGVQGEKTLNDRGDIFPNEITGAPSDYPYQFGLEIHGDYLTFPRRLFFDYYAHWLTKSFALLDSAAPFAVNDWRIVYDIGNYLLSRPNAVLTASLYGKRVYEQDEVIYTQNKSVLEPSPWDFPNTNLFPASPSLPVTNAYGRPLQIRAFWFTWTTGRDLKAIIKQNGNFYYVWNRPTV